MFATVFAKLDFFGDFGIFGGHGADQVLETEFFSLKTPPQTKIFYYKMM
jgi:hypothetical protein